MFNAIKYTKNLEESGFEREQAESLVGIFMQMMEFNMVSRADFEKFQHEMYNRFDKVDERFDKIDERFDRFEVENQQKLDRFGLKLTVKLGSMIALSMGLMATILAIKL